MSFFQRWLREFTQFLFSKGNALALAIGVGVGTSSSRSECPHQRFADATDQPIRPQGDWKDLMLPYFGGEIAIGKLMDITLNSLVVGWALFFLFKAIKGWNG